MYFSTYLHAHKERCIIDLASNMLQSTLKIIKKMSIAAPMIFLLSCDLKSKTNLSINESTGSSCTAMACFHNTILPNQFVLSGETYVFTGTKYELQSETRYSDLIAYWINENDFTRYNDVLTDAPIIVDATNSIYVYDINYGEIRYFDSDHETICVVTASSCYCCCNDSKIVNREIRIYGVLS